MSKECFTPLFRLSFPKLFAPDEQNGKYSIQMVIPNNSDFTAMKAAVDAVIAEAFPNGVPAGVRLPFTDGNTKESPDYHNCTLVNANNKYQPGMCDTFGQPVTAMNKDKLYPGCWCRAQVSAYYYQKAGKGIAFSLQNIMFVKDDTPFAGTRQSANEAFGQFIQQQPATQAPPAQPQTPVYQAPPVQPVQPQTPVYQAPPAQPQTQPTFNRPAYDPHTDPNRPTSDEAPF